MKIWTVDAFTDKPFSGNPAAIAIVEDFPADEICQKVAAEFNLSETAFLKPLGPDHFHIRWFTPSVEVQLCGHATLASAHILFQEGLIGGAQIRLESLSGALFVTRGQNEIVLDFPLQQIGEAFPVSSLGNLFDPTTIVNAVRAYDDVIVELSDDALVRNLKLDSSKASQIDCRGLIVTARGRLPYDFVSRVFGPRLGVDEDPVTGSAHCKLADYWQKKLNKKNFLAYQASSRGGVLGVEIVGNRVHLRGQAVTIMEGKYLPSLSD